MKKKSFKPELADYARVILGLMVIVTFLMLLTRKVGQQSHEAADLQPPTEVATTNGQLVQEIVVQDVSDERIRAISDSIFKLADKELRKIKTAHRLHIMEMSVRLGDTVLAGFTDTSRRSYENTPCDSLRELLKTAIIPPKEYLYDSDSLRQHGYVLKEGVSIDFMHIPNTMYSREITEKSGFLNLSRQRMTQVYNSNSMLRVDSMAYYQVPQRLTWWQRWGKPIVAGAVAGTAVYLIGR